jgi:hypothetical protein
MTTIDRRQLLGAALVSTVAIGNPATVRAATPNISRFIYDGRFEAALREAAGWRAAGVQVVDSRQTDLGTFWREVAAGRIPANGVAGLTLWMDSFICETFGRDHGMRIQRTTMDLGHGLKGWILR